MKFHEHENPRLESTRRKARVEAIRLSLDPSAVEAAVDRFRTVSDTEEHHEHSLVAKAVDFIRRDTGKK